MPRLPQDQIEALSAAIRSHEFLHRILRQIEVLQRTVFHANERADWTQTRRSAEQMLIAEIALRYRGDIDRVYFRLREIEKSGRDWAAAITEVASAIHSYFTTPLGMVMRRDLYGDDAAYLSPDAIGWMAQVPGAATKAPLGRTPPKNNVDVPPDNRKPARMRAEPTPSESPASAEAGTTRTPASRTRKPAKRSAKSSDTRSSAPLAKSASPRAKSSRAARPTKSAKKGRK